MRANAPDARHPGAALTPRQRLARGLAYTAAGPVDVTRGAVGLGLHSARTGAANLRWRYRESRLAREVAAVPETIVTEYRRNRRPWVIGGAAAALLIGGAAAVVVIRRSAAPRPAHEPSPRPPSVDVRPTP